MMFINVHHAYLLLHRAMSLLPPTMIPDIEPTPLPSTGVWNQPTGFLPDLDYSDETNAFHLCLLIYFSCEAKPRHVNCPPCVLHGAN